MYMLAYLPEKADDLFSDEDGGQEREKIMTALNNSKDTLDYVNQAVTESENKNRLKEIEEKTDASPYKKTLIKLSLDNKVSEHTT